MADVAVLNVLLHGRPIATLTRVPGDRILFALNEDYIEDASRPTLSLSFKDVFGDLITEFKPTQTRVSPFFANLLPEGAMRDYLARKAAVDPQREFFLLWVLGRDLPGAVEVHPADGEIWPDDSEPGDTGGGGGSDAREHAMRFSLAGVQLKFSAVKEASGGLTIPVNGVGGSWIVKLPSMRFPGIPENEFAMMNLAKRAGIDVPETALLPIESIAGLPEGIDGVGRNAFAIRRFDRTAKGERIHVEDFAQVFGVYPDRKYKVGSYRNIAEVIWTETGEKGIAAFIRRFVFNALIGNADMHLKNWSLTYPDGRAAALAPAYDFVSTIPYLKDDSLALNFVDSKAFESLTVDQFARFSAKARLPEKLVLDTLEESVEAFAEAWRTSRDLPVAPHVRAAIDAHLKTLPIWRKTA